MRKECDTQVDGVTEVWRRPGKKFVSKALMDYTPCLKETAADLANSDPRIEYVTDTCSRCGDCAELECRVKPL